MNTDQANKRGRTATLSQNGLGGIAAMLGMLNENCEGGQKAKKQASQVDHTVYCEGEFVRCAERQYIQTKKDGSPSALREDGSAVVNKMKIFNVKVTPILDKEKNPVLDADGNPTFKTKAQPNCATSLVVKLHLQYGKTPEEIHAKTINAKDGKNVCEWIQDSALACKPEHQEAMKAHFRATFEQLNVTEENATALFPRMYEEAAEVAPASAAA